MDFRRRIGANPRLEAVCHLSSLTLPLTTLGFLLSGPHASLGALAWTIPFWLILVLDWKGPRVAIDTVVPLEQRFYNGILFALAGLQLINIYLMIVVVSQLSWENWDDFFSGVINLIVIRFLVGTSSSLTGIVLAHELIHRKQGFWRGLGRLLLSTVCFEHFIIAHLEGHHSADGVSGDIAGARLNESFSQYWQRVLVGNFGYAWQSENKRLQINQPFWKNPALFRHRVLQGIVFEIFLMLLILINFGWLAMLVFLYQAFVAVRILEAVNYVQHWGLQEGRFGKSYGWVCNSWITKYSLLGLSYHIGHHQDEAKPFYEIAYSDQGPMMPYGYFVMNLWAKIHNASYQRVAHDALVRFKERYCARA